LSVHGYCEAVSGVAARSLVAIEDRIMQIRLENRILTLELEINGIKSNSNKIRTTMNRNRSDWNEKAEH
jgi:hypothetical protein